MRTKDEILNDLQAVECNLSPENLSCDGELPISQIRKRHSELVKQRQQLIAELRYEPTFNELFGV